MTCSIRANTAHRIPEWSDLDTERDLIAAKRLQVHHVVGGGILGTILNSEELQAVKDPDAVNRLEFEHIIRRCVGLERLMAYNEALWRFSCGSNEPLKEFKFRVRRVADVLELGHHREIDGRLHSLFEFGDSCALGHVQHQPSREQADPAEVVGNQPK